MYAGINAHLNSYLQQTGGGWESFHAEHIIQLRRTIDQALPENYFALAEKSLQVTEVESDRYVSSIRPDVGIYEGRPSEAPISVVPTVTSPAEVMPLDRLVPDDVDYLTAIGIYKIEGKQLPGTLVTQLEVLSPKNKRQFAQYGLKRLQTLQNGINLVELDYLHEIPPIIPYIPSYPDRQDNATPYYVLVSNPHPTYAEGTATLYGFAIDSPLPTIAIPLAKDDLCVLSLQPVYEATIDNTRAFQLMIDLSSDPKNVAAYTDNDQAYIRRIMSEATTSAPDVNDE